MRDLRACCMCGLLKTERMWLEFGCENCPFLIEPGTNDRDRVEACTTALHEGRRAAPRRALHSRGAPASELADGS